MLNTTIKTTDILSMKSFLIGSILLDFFNDHDNTATIIFLKDDIIYKISLLSSTLKQPKVRLINQLSSPIKDIFTTTELGNQVIVFVIGINEYNFNIITKKINYTLMHDGLNLLNETFVNHKNYKTIFPNYHFHNYENVKEALNSGIKLSLYSGCRKITTPTGVLLIVRGISVADNSKQTLIFEKV